MRENGVTASSAPWVSRGSSCKWHYCHSLYAGACGSLCARLEGRCQMRRTLTTSPSSSPAASRQEIACAAWRCTPERLRREQPSRGA
eukprot:6186342-Pleurochrysis_carterae.AAC.1